MAKQKSNVEEMTCSNEEFSDITIDDLNALVESLKTPPLPGLYLASWVNEGYTLPNGDHVVPRRWLADMSDDERREMESWHVWTLNRDGRVRWRGLMSRRA